MVVEELVVVELVVVDVLVVLVLVEIVVEGAGAAVEDSDVLIVGAATPVADISELHAAAEIVTAMARRVVRFTGSTVPDRNDVTLAP